MKRVLLTGATGFIGRHCLPLLSARAGEVHAVSRKAPQPNRQDINWHQADLLDSQQVSNLIAKVQPTHLLHFAWFAVPGKYWTALENFRWVQASLDLLQAFAQYGGQRVVMAGTCAEYDWRYGYCCERVTPLLPASAYGICKHALHLMLEAFSAQTGLSAAWGRIFFVYGPHEHPCRLVPSVICSLLRGEKAHCSHGNQIRDFLPVWDVAQACVTLLESQVSGAVNIASGQPVALREIIYKIAEKMGRPDLIHLGSLPTPASDTHLLVADVSRLTDEVGWSPSSDLDAGLEKTIEWWRASLSY
ncbi:NAD-dependent epimerase/dehydratase family protein [Kamptonema formosum]|uniref:NAD-dependent epimerase/dehydratase family protein n=1 Tax=Kamptonema formosum TaxID=331992 RepID=UPI00034B3F0A|nr:NAD(P)-dependent oxidoreductase [Oscillatoria sp. PCC 10802]